jgi:hypothetical protein
MSKAKTKREVKATLVLLLDFAQQCAVAQQVYLAGIVSAPFLPVSLLESYFWV